MTRFRRGMGRGLSRPVLVLVLALVLVCGFAAAGTAQAMAGAPSVRVLEAGSPDAAALTYYLSITTAETTSTTAYDKLSVSVNGTTVGSTYSNLNKGSYVQRQVTLSSYAGQTVTIKWTGTEDASLATSFFVDDTALTAS